MSGQAGAGHLALLREQRSEMIVKPKGLPVRNVLHVLLPQTPQLALFLELETHLWHISDQSEGLVSFFLLLPLVSCYFEDTREYIRLSIKSTTSLVAQRCKDPLTALLFVTEIKLLLFLA